MVTVRVIPIIPDKLFDEKKMRQELKSGCDRTGERMRKKLDKTVSGWGGVKPKIESETEVGDTASVWCGPTGDEEGIQKWIRLDEGTDPHPITPRGNYPLRFPFQGPGQSYSARTRPRYLGSDAGTGEKFGPEYKPWAVKHPGHDPREWSEELLDQEEPGFVKEMQNAVDRGLE